ncbi:methionyl-tRNA formyltransferase [Jatrophihabitans sp. GAS493]|uniref:methionyl-tRNA formyltransferase n=1 Tax=Jatrophihabitans sp. GAS493 TaxID=1907575 RepID=UPI000BB82679|nr:methionyl-tRNA formyltransferase [Jatrophihabitans sp. GAS493]SOD73726.1 methionyl-tRNA formyltransferase [Jatrophihabitans sp. GAS493]
MRLLFAGTPQPAVASLQALLDSPRHEVVGVLTRPAARSGRGRRESISPVQALAEKHGLPVLSPQRTTDPEFVAALTRLQPDCCPVVAYGALLREPALSLPRHGWVNLHFSLLPAWRGAAPVQHAILAGDEITGASTFRIEAGLDTGPVFGVVTEAIDPADTAADLLDRLAISGADLLVATMDGIADGSLRPVEQPGDGVSLAPKIEVDDAKVDFEAPAQRVDRLIRACSPNPGAWTIWRGDRLKLGPVRLLTERSLAPGEIRADKQQVSVGTATADVALSTVQPAGKRPTNAADWARGARIEAAERLG